MRGDIGSWIVTGVLLVAVASACGANNKDVDTSRSTTTVSVEPQAIGVPLYEQFESASAEGPNGTPIDATLGGVDYPNSTGMWVGCRGSAATTTYRLDRNFTRLTATAGIRAQAPDGLAVRVTISGDGQPLSEFSVSKTATTPVDLKVDRTDSLVVAAILEEGRCAPGDDPFGALGDAVLTTTRD